MSHTDRSSRVGAVGLVALGIVLFILVAGLWALLWVPPAPGF